MNNEEYEMAIEALEYLLEFKAVKIKELRKEVEKQSELLSKKDNEIYRICQMGGKCDNCLALEELSGINSVARGAEYGYGPGELFGPDNSEGVRQPL